MCGRLLECISVGDVKFSPSLSVPSCLLTVTSRPNIAPRASVFSAPEETNPWLVNVREIHGASRLDHMGDGDCVSVLMGTETYYPLLSAPRNRKRRKVRGKEFFAVNE